MTTVAVQKQKETPAPAPAPRAARNPFQLMRSFMNWDPFQEMTPTIFQATELSWLPDFDVREDKNGYLFRADVPGVKEADLSVTVTGNQLLVSGKRAAEEKRSDEHFYLYERSYGSFSRTFTLPDTADCEKCAADLKDGVLTITVPKKPETQPKKVNIAAAKG